MMLLAPKRFLDPYMVSAMVGRGLTFHLFLQSSAKAVKFQAVFSNMSLTPSKQNGITISEQACKSKQSKSS